MTLKPIKKREGGGIKPSKKAREEIKDEK